VNTTFIEIDLVQAEWVCTAYIAPDAQMLEVVEKKLDPHVRTGQLISGAPVDLIVDEHRLVGHLTDPNDIARARVPLEQIYGDMSDYWFPRTMSIRQCGKKGNHALNYGMGPGTFALWSEMPESDAARVHAAYHKAYPGLGRYYGRIEDELKASRSLVNCFGDKRRFLDVWGIELFKAAYAYKPQSTVGRVTNNGLASVYHDDSRLLQNVKIAAQNHDSILLHIQYDTWHELSEIVHTCADYMSTPCIYHGVEFILEKEIKMGTHWGESTAGKMTTVERTGYLAEDLERTHIVSQAG
jgi:DNA polymerase I-like protein with 3'-5' exonuclease and polymerase domains